MHQSAYRKDRSTETAVLSVCDCLLVKADERHVSLLALLDLSAAFDTLDHSILLKVLEVTFGVQGTVLSSLHPMSMIVVSLVLLMVLCLLLVPLCMNTPGFCSGACFVHAVIPASFGCSFCS